MIRMHVHKNTIHKLLNNNKIKYQFQTQLGASFFLGFGLPWNNREVERSTTNKAIKIKNLTFLKKPHIQTFKITSGNRTKCVV